MAPLLRNLKPRAPRAPIRSAPTGPAAAPTTPRAKRGGAWAPPHRCPDRPRWPPHPLEWDMGRTQLCPSGASKSPLSKGPRRGPAKSLTTQGPYASKGPISMPILTRLDAASSGDRLYLRPQRTLGCIYALKGPWAVSTPSKDPGLYLCPGSFEALGGTYPVPSRPFTPYPGGRGIHPPPPGWGIPWTSDPPCPGPEGEGPRM
jgi:hypothetical protein